MCPGPLTLYATRARTRQAGSLSGVGVSTDCGETIIQCCTITKQSRRSQQINDKEIKKCKGDAMQDVQE